MMYTLWGEVHQFVQPQAHPRKNNSSTLSFIKFCLYTSTDWPTEDCLPLVLSPSFPQPPRRLSPLAQLLAREKGWESHQPETLHFLECSLSLEDVRDETPPLNGCPLLWLWGETSWSLSPRPSFGTDHFRGSFADCCSREPAIQGRTSWWHHGRRPEDTPPSAE